MLSGQINREQNVLAPLPAVKELAMSKDIITAFRTGRRRNRIQKKSTVITHE
jgi:hypothetical protein